MKQKARIRQHPPATLPVDATKTPVGVLQLKNAGGEVRTRTGDLDD